MDKELASFHTYLFSLCLNAGAAQATSTGNRQLKLTRRSWLPAEQYCQVEQASTAPAQTSWRTGLISLAMIATLPTYPVHYNSFCGSSHFLFFFAVVTTNIRLRQKCYTNNRFQYWKRSEMVLSNLTQEWGRQKTKTSKHTESCFVSKKVSSPFIKTC